jgi:hypothetical protein
MQGAFRAVAHSGWRGGGTGRSHGRGGRAFEVSEGISFTGAPQGKRGDAL